MKEVLLVMACLIFTKPYDQMARLFSQFVSIYSNEDLPNCKKLQRVGNFFAKY